MSGMDVLSPRPLALVTAVLVTVGVVPLAWGWTTPALAVVVVLAGAAVVVPALLHARLRAAVAAAETSRSRDVARLLTDLARLEARRELD